jgi:hypothetical protein
MARDGTWVAYQGGGRVALAVVLLVLAGLILGLGSRIRRDGFLKRDVAR